MCVCVCVCVCVYMCVYVCNMCVRVGVCVCVDYIKPVFHLYIINLLLDQQIPLQ